MNEAKYISPTTNGSPLDPATGLSGRRITRFSPPAFAHIPVMAEIVTETFSTVPSGPILDATIGGGGHSYEILKSREDLNLIGIDQDPEALAAAESKLMGFENRVALIHGRFDDLSVVTKHIGKEKLSGFLFDLGVSSYQLDNPHSCLLYTSPSPRD